MQSVSTTARPIAHTSLRGVSAPATESAPWWKSTLAVALVGQALYWSALPPLGLAPLAWLAPLPWVMLIRMRRLGGKRPYAALWLSSVLFNLAAFYWVTLPHWATAFGWLAMSAYLAVYFPLFIGLSRVAVHGLRVSPIVAAPVVWTGLELARAHMLTGFAMGNLSHTQYRWTELLQVVDLMGAYGVSFAIVFVGACLARMLPCEGRRGAWWPALPLALVLAAMAGYGVWRTHEQTTEPGPKVALVQGSIDIEMKYDPKQGQRIFDEYFGLSRQAVAEHPDLDLIVWPETMFRYPWFTFGADFVPPADATWTAAEVTARSHEAVEQVALPLGVPLLLGIDAVHETRERTERFNSALFFDPTGRELGRYAKYHLVPFGEYVPGADVFPWLYRLTPLPGGLDRGSGPQSVSISGTRYSPNICYENTIPHLIRAQVSQLRSEDREPDVLVNLTNDGWFWGSTELDMHLACSVFRAIECRKPFLVAANTGFSAWVDSNGRLLAQGRRRATDTIVATPAIDRRRSAYVAFGDMPSFACLLACGGLAMVGLNARRHGKRAENGQSQ
jgi:apolipoprotein N-acyltransferase